MKLEQAKALKPGDRVHYTGKISCSRTTGSRGRVHTKVVSCRVSGQPQIWKRSPERVKVPIKYGMYENSYINEYDLDDWHLESECPLLEEESVDPQEV